MRPLLIVVTLAFTAWTGWLIVDVGYAGFYRQLLGTVSGWQVLVDIVIALSIVLGWIRGDARRSRRAFWPYAAVTVALGSIGPLLYLVLRRETRS